VTGRFRPYLV